ncbi:MAG TPA: hypothetical protein RMG45_06975, partial [Polyangiaceae bacterium LLY-WYZ-15_(1-7)]|nr:hypothetical protein [Polyangiaceae bacterium LLY-WYZ-15_(1-7)]
MGDHRETPHSGLKILLILGAMLGLGGFAFWKLGQVEEEAGRLAAEVVEPHLEAVRAEEWDAARQLASAAWQERWAEGTLAAAYDALVEEHGPLERWERRATNEVQRAGEAFHRIQYVLHFARGRAHVAFDVVAEGEG